MSGWLVRIAACGVALSLGGCGEDENPARSVRLDAAADGSLRFERSTLSASAGPTTIVMGNPSRIPHAIGIRGAGADETGKTVSTDGTSRIEVDLRSGTYLLLCPVAGHERAGMTAELTVP